jgi:hypothetical protein
LFELFDSRHACLGNKLSGILLPPSNVSRLSGFGPREERESKPIRRWAEVRSTGELNEAADAARFAFLNPSRQTG